MSEFPSQHETRGSEQEGESEPLTRLLARYWILFKKYYWILIATCALGVVGSYFYTQRQPKIYAASTKIIFREAPNNVFGRSIERVDLVDPGGMWQFEQFWNTQREVMRSRWFAEKVVEFEGLIDEEGFVPNRPDASRDELRKTAAGRVLGSSDVALQPGSRVAIVTVETTTPRHAQLVADGIADTYVQYTRDFQSGGLNKIVEWFDRNGIAFEIEEGLCGGCAYDAHGVPITDETMDAIAARSGNSRTTMRPPAVRKSSITACR